MKLHKIILAIVLYTQSNVLFAQSIPVTNTDYSTTIGTTAQMIVPANSQRKTLWIENPSATSGTPPTIAYCIATSPGTSCTPAINTAGSSTLNAGVGDGWLGFAPIGPIYGIASAGATAVTIRSGQ